MASRSKSRRNHTRMRIAHEAARLMLDGGIRDFALAKRKAAQRLQVWDAGQLPRNDEIELAVQEYQRLFRADRQPERLYALRRAAVQAMRFLVQFEPRLVGPVLSGTADQHTEVTLHLFAEPPEQVAMFLLEQGIPHELMERRVRMSADDARLIPGYRFVADEIAIELVVFPFRGQRQPPLSPVDGKPMQRANLAAVEALSGGDLEAKSGVSS